MDFTLGILIGALVGGVIGAMTVAACAAGKQADRYIDHSGYDDDENDYSRRPRNGF
jgi:gas vesicle protein